MNNIFQCLHISTFVSLIRRYRFIIQYRADGSRDGIYNVVVWPLIHEPSAVSINEMSFLLAALDYISCI